MAKRIDDGGPAFPTSLTARRDEYIGISTRDYFAAKAMAAILAATGGERNAEVLAEDAYIYADAMLVARKKVSQS
jgi:hypothetical protein